MLLDRRVLQAQRGSPSIAHSRIRRRQSQCAAMFAHGELLVCLDFQIGTGTGGAEENESGCSIFREIGYCIACVEVAGVEQAPCAGEAAALMADRR